MTLEEFKSSLTHPNPPGGLRPELLALWYDAKGDWEKSHSIIQDIETKDAALIHAYLHRKEGDQWNAEYWYRRADVKTPDISLENELDRLIIKNLQ
ncbi:MAG TPA: hypothetical protein VGK46_07540 [Saprospiraceae bacterium]|jgi:hypothetical protein